MNKDEFKQNRQIFRMLSTDLLNQMNNMYDQLAVADQRIENARKEGFEAGLANGSKIVRCKNCRFFLPVGFYEAYADTDPKSVFVQTTKVCIKSHNGYETFGCTEGEPNV